MTDAILRLEGVHTHIGQYHILHALGAAFNMIRPSCLDYPSFPPPTAEIVRIQLDGLVAQGYE